MFHSLIPRTDILRIQNPYSSRNIYCGCRFTLAVKKTFVSYIFIIQFVIARQVTWQTTQPTSNCVHTASFISTDGGVYRQLKEIQYMFHFDWMVLPSRHVFSHSMCCIFIILRICERRFLVKKKKSNRKWGKTRRESTWTHTQWTSLGWVCCLINICFYTHLNSRRWQSNCLCDKYVTIRPETERRECKIISVTPSTELVRSERTSCWLA